MNSIAAYMMVRLFRGFMRGAVERQLPDALFKVAGPASAPFVVGCGVVGVMWLLLFRTCRRTIFLRI